MRVRPGILNGHEAERLRAGSQCWERIARAVRDLGIEPRAPTRLVEAISDSVAAVAPQVRAAMKTHPEFSDIGKRMLMTRAQGVHGLRDERAYAVGGWEPGKALTNFSAPPQLKAPKAKIGRSPLLGKR